MDGGTPFEFEFFASFPCHSTLSSSSDQSFIRYSILSLVMRVWVAYFCNTTNAATTMVFDPLFCCFYFVFILFFRAAAGFVKNKMNSAGEWPGNGHNTEWPSKWVFLFIKIIPVFFVYSFSFVAFLRRYEEYFYRRHCIFFIVRLHENVARKFLSVLITFWKLIFFMDF